MPAGSILMGLGAKGMSAAAKVGMPNMMGGLSFARGLNNELKHNDRSVGGAIMKSGVNAMLIANNPYLYAGAQLAPAVVQGAQAAHVMRRTKAEEFANIRHYSQQVGGQYMDTNQALTMRQAAVEQIQGNKLNARSALGGEARIFSNRRFTG